MSRPYDKSNKQDYQRRYRAQVEGKYCACGRPAFVHRASAFLCDRCARDQDREHFDALHKPTCGFDDGGGLAVHALCLPNGVSL